MADPMAPIRAEVMAQPLPDRLEYALDLLAYYMAPAPPFFDGCRRLGLALQPADLRMLHALDRRRGQVVTLESLAAARELGCAGPCDPSGSALRNGISKIRTCLEGRGVPVTIENVYGLGYLLEAPPGFRFDGVAP